MDWTTTTAKRKQLQKHRICNFSQSLQYIQKHLYSFPVQHLNRFRLEFGRQFFFRFAPFVFLLEKLCHCWLPVAFFVRCVFYSILNWLLLLLWHFVCVSIEFVLSGFDNSTSDFFLLLCQIYIIHILFVL